MIHHAKSIISYDKSYDVKNFFAHDIINKYVFLNIIINNQYIVKSEIFLLLDYEILKNSRK